MLKYDKGFSSRSENIEALFSRLRQNVRNDIAISDSELNNTKEFYHPGKSPRKEVIHRLKMQILF